jgi:hypothetical protein
VRGRFMPVILGRESKTVAPMLFIVVRNPANVESPP